MKGYYRLMLGRGSAHAEECFANGFVGVDFDIDRDVTGDLAKPRREFNEIIRPLWLAKHPDKTKVAAGLACGFLYTLCNGVHEGDIILSPDGMGAYRVGEITGPYAFHPSGVLPHRRPVTWLSEKIRRDDMSEALRNSTGSLGTLSEVTKHAEEIEQLIGGQALPKILATDPDIEDPSEFALEKHLEDFLVANWESTELGRAYDIVEEDGELVGQQYPSDTGPIDILAISKDKRELLVVELKKGRASDVVVGQIQRYMGYVLEELAEDEQSVKGVIIALEDDLRIRRALKVAHGIEFYRYEVRFTLTKQSL